MIRQIAPTVAFSAIVAGLIIYALLQFTGTPDVIFSWETKQCVKVINADGSVGDCAHLPEKYTHIWGR